MLARNLPPVSRGSPDQRGGVQLNRLLVSYRCSVSVGLEAHPWEGQLRAWLLLQAARSRRRKGRRVNVPRAVCSQPRRNRAVPSLQSRPLPELAIVYEGMLMRFHFKASITIVLAVIRLPILPKDVPRPSCGFRLSVLFSVRSFAQVTALKVARLDLTGSRTCIAGRSN